MSRLLLFNKPYGVLCTFTDPEDRPNLSHFVNVPKVYAAGRLDSNTEGLMVLTDDGALQDRISHPRNGKEKGYWAQVEGIPEARALQTLRNGVTIKGRQTRPARVRQIEAPTLWDRDPPVRFRAHIPTSWLELFIQEGMNRQVRRMTAAAGFPTLRLVRFQVGPYLLGALKPGEWREV
jgi:23S rRNA pseudouridine2457 synthase